jgi:hypothetical protein
MNLKDKRKIVKVIIFIALVIGGWGIYAKKTEWMIGGLVVALLFAIFEEKIIRWF